MLKKIVLVLVLTSLLILAFNRCSPAKQETPTNNEEPITRNGELDYTRAEEEQLFNETFRIDIKRIEVTFDYVPEEGNYHADCQAILTFSMRPGQRRALIHLEPATRDKTVTGIRLNGEYLDFSNEEDVKHLEFTSTTRKALEFQRDLAENRDHRLEISYRLPIITDTPMFYTKVNDYVGRGNEEVFPTLNAPQELARHYLTFRVHSDAAYRCIGSGLVEAVPSSDVQQWTLDSEQEVASYTVMFFLAPAADTVLEERSINGVDVRVMAFVNGASLDTAFSSLESWLPELQTNLGPFPMPRGLSIFLVGSGGGMEYYGATITSQSALLHEVFHMYYGCSTVNKTYRDSWLDEAVNQWYEYSKNQNFLPISESFRSAIVSGRSPVQEGFDSRAYQEGARILQAVAKELGGREQMVGFLRHIQQNYSFAPFTTQDFLDYLQDYAGLDMRQRFLNWLYCSEKSSKTKTLATTPLPSEKKVNLTPPDSILKKYQPSL